MVITVSWLTTIQYKKFKQKLDQPRVFLHQDTIYFSFLSFDVDAIG